MQACRGCPVMGAAMSGSYGRMLERARRVGAPCKPCWATPEVTVGGFIGQFGDASGSRGGAPAVASEAEPLKSFQQQFSRTDYSLLQLISPRSCRSFDSPRSFDSAFTTSSVLHEHNQKVLAYLWCPSIASQGTRPSSTSLCPIWHRWLVIWTSNAAIIIV